MFYILVLLLHESFGTSKYTFLPMAVQGPRFSPAQKNYGEIHTRSGKPTVQKIS